MGYVSPAGPIFVWKMGTFESYKFYNLIYYKEDLFGLTRKKSKLLEIDITKLSHNKFYKNETEKLIKLYNNGYNIEEIAIQLNRKIDIVYQKLIQLNLYYSNNPHYTIAEENFIKENYDIKNPKKSMMFIAKILNRTLLAINRKVTSMKIRNTHHKFTKQDIDFIKKNRKMGIKWIANELNLPYQSISSKINRMGL
jgi:hypothetical protein